MEKKDQNRATLSCIECRRRKQKCSREWPCNHCVARKVSHLCTFGNKGHLEDSKALKRRNEDVDIDSGIEADLPGIEALGYLDHHSYLNIASGVWLSHEIKPAPVDVTEDLQKAVQVLPTRSIVDALVQNFVSVVNYNYNAIYAPTFLEAYTSWWADKAARRPLSPEYTCLLLRACALSTQAMPSKLRNTLEFELAEDPALLPERFHQAAELLSGNFAPAERGLVQIQQLFLVVCWFKNEGRFIDSWHAMAKCVREAQEMKLHLDDSKLNISEYDREMRRRVMTIIFVWDWLMSRWLARPLLVDPESCTFQDPTLQLEQNPDEPGLPSAFTQMTLQMTLIRRVTPALSHADKHPSEDSVKALCRIVDEWHESLPPVFRRDNPDTSFDSRYQYLTWQRLLLHGTMAMVEQTPVKPYLTGAVVASSTKTQEYFRNFGIERCLTSLRTAIAAYGHMKDLDPKHFYINYVIFDTLTIMCSAIIHDHKHKNLPHRQAVLEGIEFGMGPLKEIAQCSGPGMTTYTFVTKLARCMSLTPEEQARWPFQNKAKRMKYESSTVSAIGVSPDEGEDSSFNGGSASGGSDSSPDKEVQIPSLQDFQDTDFGGIEELWDWTALNIETDVANEINFTGFGGSTSN